MWSTSVNCHSQQITLVIFDFWIVVIFLSYGLLFFCVDDPLCSAFKVYA